jgi:hypothetical protein
MAENSINQSDASIQCVSKINKPVLLKDHLGLNSSNPMAVKRKRRKYFALGKLKSKSILLKKEENSND